MKRNKNNLQTRNIKSALIYLNVVNVKLWLQIRKFVIFWKIKINNIAISVWLKLVTKFKYFRIHFIKKLVIVNYRESVTMLK